MPWQFPGAGNIGSIHFGRPGLPAGGRCRRGQGEGRLQRRRELAAPRVPVGRGLRESPCDDAVDRGRKLRTNHAQRRHRVVDLRVQRRYGLAAVEWRLSGEQGEGHASQRILVGPSVHGSGPDLLGRAVFRSTDELAGSRQPGGGPSSLGEPEVGQEGMFGQLGGGVDKDVLRLDVPVHESGRVRGVEGRCHLRCQCRHAIRSEEPPCAAGQRRQVTAGREPRRDIESSLGLARPVDGNHVLRVDRGHCPRFPQEPRAKLRVACHLWRDYLYRRKSPEHLIAGAEYDGHPARADLLFDHVACYPAPRFQFPEDRDRLHLLGFNATHGYETGRRKKRFLRSEKFLFILAGGVFRPALDGFAHASESGTKSSLLYLTAPRYYLRLHGCNCADTSLPCEKRHQVAPVATSASEHTRSTRQLAIDLDRLQEAVVANGDPCQVPRQARRSPASSPNPR